MGNVQPPVSRDETDAASTIDQVDRMTIRLIQGCAVIVAVLSLAFIGQVAWNMGKWAVTHKSPPQSATSSQSNAPKPGPTHDDTSVPNVQEDNDSANRADEGEGAASESSQEDRDEAHQEEPSQQDQGGSLQDAWDAAKDTGGRAGDWLKQSTDDAKKRIQQKYEEYNKQGQKEEQSSQEK